MQNTILSNAGNVDRKGRLPWGRERRGREDGKDLDRLWRGVGVNGESLLCMLCVRDVRAIWI